MKCSETMRGWVLGLTTAVTAVLLTACGGSSRIDPFVPVKLVAFGDEASVIEADGKNGKKYTVNGYNAATPPALDCAVNPIWVQYLASNLNMVFQQCPGTRTDYQAQIKAVAGAKVVDVTGQIQGYIAANAIGAKDLFTVYAGQNDLIAIYEDATVTDKKAAAEAAGTALAQQVNALAIAGGRVLFVTVPDLGLTPYARAKAAATDPNAVAMLSMLSERFNTKLSVGVINDGRIIGMVSAEEMTQIMVRAPGAYSLNNITDAACKSTIAVKDCTGTAADLIDAAAPSGATFLWASDRQLGAVGHSQLGQRAVVRAKNNPF